jgi:hypothetical protein
MSAGSRHHKPTAQKEIAMYPVDVTADYGDGMRSRGRAALGVLFPLKMLLAAPHQIIL